MKSKEELLIEMQEAWNKPDSLQQCINVAERYAIEKQIQVLEKVKIVPTGEHYYWIGVEIESLKTKLKS